MSASKPLTNRVVGTELPAPDAERSDYAPRNCQEVFMCVCNGFAGVDVAAGVDKGNERKGYSRWWGQ